MSIWLNRCRLFLLLSLIGFINNAMANAAVATRVKTIVEFFSFRCIHCANVNNKLNQYVIAHNVKYLDVNIDISPQALKTTIIYYVAVDAGVGVEFKDTYFKAVLSGMPVYAESTLAYVVNAIKNKTMGSLLKSQIEQQRIKQKLDYVQPKFPTNYT